MEVAAGAQLRQHGHGQHLDAAGEQGKGPGALNKEIRAAAKRELGLETKVANKVRSELLEMGYLTNAEQEAQLNAADFQNTLVQAVFDAVLRFRDMLGAGTR